jgi:hypothetical protein
MYGTHLQGQHLDLFELQAEINRNPKNVEG